MDSGPILFPHGGYQSQEAYKLAEVVYDATEAFCLRAIDERSRTRDQMVQAARSGKQNIAEGSMASGTSKKMELKLVSVARASLEELKLDFEDFLRTHDLEKWDKDHEKAAFIRKLARRRDKSYKTYKTYVEQKTLETSANTVLCVIHQTCFLLDRLKQQLEKSFLEEGGFTERLYKSRSRARQSK